jgi:hypothetical protein
MFHGHLLRLLKTIIRKIINQAEATMQRTGKFFVRKVMKIIPVSLN